MGLAATVGLFIMNKSPDVFIPLKHRAHLPRVMMPDQITWEGPKIVPVTGILTPEQTMFGDRLLMIRGTHKYKCLTPKGTMARPKLHGWFVYGPKSPAHEVMGNLQDTVDTIANGLDEMVAGKDMRNFENKMLDEASEKASQKIDIVPGTVFAQS